MCAATFKVCAAASEDIFLCVAASGNISCFFKERAAASERYQKKCASASERKCSAAS